MSDTFSVSEFSNKYIFDNKAKLPSLEEQIQYVDAIQVEFGDHAALFLDSLVKKIFKHANRKDQNGHSVYNFEPYFHRLQSDKLVAALKGEDVVVIKTPSYHGCDTCGETITFELKGQTVTCVSEPCQQRLEAFEVIIDCPSGELYVNDYIGEMRTICDNDGHDYDVNRFIGLRKTTEAYADYGFFYSFVGNSCPRIWDHDGTILIGSAYDEETDEAKPLGGPDAVEVGYVCTDLWWTSMVDVQILEEQCRKNNVDVPEKGSYDIVKVKPGRYKCTSYYGANKVSGGVYLKLELL
ncbi:hypothetical protein VPHD479_0350 [Vibrio phage D479]